MWTSAVYKRCWLKNAHLIFICCSNFSCVCTTIQTTNPNIIVYSSRNYLDSLKIVGQDHNIASSCVCLSEINRITVNLNIKLNWTIFNFLYFCTVFVHYCFYTFIIFNKFLPCIEHIVLALMKKSSSQSNLTNNCKTRKINNLIFRDTSIQHI